MGPKNIESQYIVAVRKKKTSKKCSDNESQSVLLHEINDISKEKFLLKNYHSVLQTPIVNIHNLWHKLKINRMKYPEDIWMGINICIVHGTHDVEPCCLCEFS